LGGPSTISQIRETIKAHHPVFFLFLKQKKKNGFVKSVVRKLNCDDRIAIVDPVGLSGGLLLFWDSNVNVIQVQKKHFYIVVEFSFDLAPPQWGIFVYFSTYKHHRASQWEEMANDKDLWGDNWFTMGDWNDIRTEEDKMRGIKRSNRSLMGFNSFINSMDMDELPMTGYQFTWCNMKSEEGLVEKKLDRAFASFTWNQNFPNATVSNKVKSSSDHSLLLLDLGYSKHKGNARFHFDKRWIGREGFKEVVEEAWSQHSERTPLFKLKEKVKRTKAALLIWSSQIKSKNQHNIDILTKKLEVLREEKSDNYWVQWNETRNDLNAAHRQEELYWQQ
ncbi:Unknown protein, partial [Striga hermonthica]